MKKDLHTVFTVATDGEKAKKKAAGWTDCDMEVTAFGGPTGAVFAREIPYGESDTRLPLARRRRWFSAKKRDEEKKPKPARQHDPKRGLEKR